MVYKKKKGWKPGANTVAYYPLENDTKDYSGNGLDGTGGSISYATLGTGKVVGSFSGNGVILPSFGNTEYESLTISCWVNANSSSSWLMMAILRDGDTNHIVDIWQQNNTGYSMSYDGSSEHRVSLGTTNGAWHNLGLVFKGSTIYGYIDGVLKGNINAGFSKLKCTTNGIGRYYDTTTYALSGQMSEVIIEKIGWDTQNFINYYNQTKANYGL